MDDNASIGSMLRTGRLICRLPNKNAIYSVFNSLYVSMYPTRLIHETKEVKNPETFRNTILRMPNP